MSDSDLGAVIAYIKSAPPVDHEQPRSSLSLTGRVIMVLLPSFTFIPAELIPHEAPRPEAPEPGITPEYGAYLTQSCKVCHGLTMSGGPVHILSPTATVRRIVNMTALAVVDANSQRQSAPL